MAPLVATFLIVLFVGATTHLLAEWIVTSFIPSARERQKRRLDDKVARWYHREE
jgi:hypothetical protein